MELDVLKCPQCFSDYDLVTHCPRIILDCGDTLCSDCLLKAKQADSFLKCPLDGKPIAVKNMDLDSFPVNSALKGIIELNSKVELCKLHKKKLKLVCLSDKQKICYGCAIFGTHKNHKVKPLAEFKEEAYEKHKKLREAGERLSEYKKNTDSILEENNTSLLEKIQTSFDEMRVAVDRKEFELICHINTFFRREKEKNEQILGIDSSFGKDICETLARQKENLKNQNYSDVVNEDISSTMSKLESELLEKNLLEIGSSLEKMSQGIDQQLSAQIRSICHFSLPAKEVCEKVNSVFYGELRHKKPAPKAAKASNMLEFSSCFDLQIASNLMKVSTTNTETKKNTSINPKDLEKIERVEIRLANYELVQEDLKALKYICGNLSKLSSLYIQFEPEDFSDEYFRGLIPTVFSSAADIEELEIRLDNCKVGDKGLEFLVEKALTRSKFLTSLHLSLKSSEITDKSLVTLVTKGLPCFKELETLRIDLDHTRITDEAACLLFRSVKEIEDLQINLRSTEITDSSLEELAKDLLSKVEFLKALKLNFGSTNISDKGITELLANIPTVESLELSFESTQMTDQSVDVLIQKTLPRLSSLKVFSILLDNTQVTPSKLERVSKITSEVSLKTKTFSVEVMVDSEADDDTIEAES